MVHIFFFPPNKPFLSFSIFAYHLYFLKGSCMIQAKVEIYRVRKGSVTVWGGWNWMNKPANQHKGRERRENIGRYIGETPSRKQMVHWVNWGKLSNRTIYKD